MEFDNKHLYCVIMCGGVGSRFWPFSRSKMPKQFLDFMGTGRSLLQMTTDRIQPLIRKENIILVTNHRYIDIVRQQLPEINPDNILLEPARRNTAPCVCWAAHHIAALDSQATIVTLPSDHPILKEETFRQTIITAAQFAETGNRLLTLGIKPRSPETGYGYIQQGTPVEGAENMMKVKSFIEKPNLEMAQMLISSGEFFWNSGIFIWRADTIIEAFRRHAPETAAIFDAGTQHYGTPTEQEFIEQEFANAPGISVDYAIMEKADNVYVQTVDLGWSDLGTWQALYDASPHNREGNAVQNSKLLTHDCTNSIFAISGDKIIVASGLDNYIVAENENAILICPLDQEQKIRQMVNEVKTHFGEKYI